MEETLAPSLRSEPGGPAAALVKRACYCAGAVDGVVEGSCKVVLQATGAAAEAARDRLAAVVEGAETWLVERSAHLVTSAYVAAGASSGESAQPQPQYIALHCIAPARHPRHPCSPGSGCTHTATVACCPPAGLYQGCKKALSTAWILLREDEVALRLATGSPVRYRLPMWPRGAIPAHSEEFQL
jgi:hypothetical protein